MSTCGCIARVDELLKPKNRKLDVTLSLSAGWARPHLTASPIEKKRGERPLTIVPEFCPFCGIKYEPPAVSS